MVLTGNKVVLREKRISDAADDYAWRRDPDLCRYDGVFPLKLSSQEFLFYFTEEVRSGEKAYRWFSIDSLEGKHIGNCMYYEVDERKKQAKLGIMIGDRDYWGQGYGTDAVNMLVDHIFRVTDLERIYLDSLEWNVRAHRCFEKCGFVVCGRVSRRGHEFLIMELRRSWLEPPRDNPSEG